MQDTQSDPHYVENALDLRSNFLKAAWDNKTTAGEQEHEPDD